MLPHVRVISQFLFNLPYSGKLIQISLYSTGQLMRLVVTLPGEFHALWWILLFGNLSLPMMEGTSHPKF